MSDIEPSFITTPCVETIPSWLTSKDKIENPFKNQFGGPESWMN